LEKHKQTDPKRWDDNGSRQDRSAAS
jgi:hypothetical protein